MIFALIILSSMTSFSQFKSLSDAFVPTLKLLHQKSFYAEPRFHASIAWALPIQQQSTEMDPLITAPVQTTAPPFLSSVLPHISDEYGGKLSQNMDSMFEVDAIEVKIGKDVHRWILESA